MTWNVRLGSLVLSLSQVAMCLDQLCLLCTRIQKYRCRALLRWALPPPSITWKRHLAWQVEVVQGLPEPDPSRDLPRCCIHCG